MEVGGYGYEFLEKLYALRVKDRVYGRMPPGGLDASARLLGVFEVASVRESYGESVDFGLLEEVLVVGLGVDSTENGVLRFAFSTIGSRDGANGEHVASACASLKA